MLNLLSPLLFPTQEISNYEELYFRGEAFGYSNECLYINKYGKLSTDTYYNSFSVNKWKYYTTLDSLILKFTAKGRFKIIILNINVVFDKMVETVIENSSYSLDDYTEISIDLSENISLDGIISFRIEAFSDVKLKDIAYYTRNIVKLPVLGLVVCTYKREVYIKKFIDSFKRYKLKDRLKAFIIDNGNTLDVDNIAEGITIIKNKNYGGAGGFGRGMLEIKDYNNRNSDSIDYVVLMDDDIYIDFNIFYKLLSFLALRKKDFTNYFLAGTMCSLDNKEIQYERYAKWCGNQFLQMSPNFNLTNIWHIIENEIIEEIDYGTSGWWFCCFSTKMLGVNNYPFPCFFRGDDIEFTIRNGFNIMTLNGINVWHEPFYKKYSIVSEDYYLLRNTLVINTLYLNWITAIDNIKYLFKRFSKSIIKYDYNSAILIIKALKDYKEGVTFFENTNPEELHKKLNEYNHKMVDIKKIKNYYCYKHIVDSIVSENDSSKTSRWIRLITFNGNLLPPILFKKEGISFIGYGARAINFYRKKSVLNFDPFTHKGYYTNRNFWKAVKLTISFILESISYYFKFQNIKRDYQVNFHKLQTETFWRKYLGVKENDK